MTRLESVRTVLDIVTTTATAVAAGALIWFLISSKTSPKAANVGPSAAEDVAGLETTAGAWTLGQGPAKIAVIEFSDLQCPYCGRYARDTYPQLESEFIRRGAVEYVFRQFPLESIHPFALSAGEAVECAGQQQRFWEMRERLFAHQDTLSRAALFDGAAALHLDRGQFEQCMDGSTVARIRADLAEGERLGVQATPTLFLGRVQANGKITLVRKMPGAVEFSVLKAELRKLMS